MFAPVVDIRMMAYILVLHPENIHKYFFFSYSLLYSPEES